MARHIAIKRLLADFKEVLEHPQPDAAAEPKDDDLFLWHANVRSRDGPLAGVPIHCLMRFTDAYPVEGPEVYLYHPLPHPNLVNVWGSARFAVGVTHRVALWDCNPSLNQWNPSYSVASTLALLASFLLDPDLLYYNRHVSLEQARAAALAFRGELAGNPRHSGTAPHPPFPTPCDLALAPSLRLVHVERPCINKELMLASTRVEPAPEEPEEQDGWRTVSGKRCGLKASKAAAAGTPAAKPPAAAPVGGDRFGVLCSLPDDEAVQGEGVGELAASLASAAAQDSSEGGEEEAPDASAGDNERAVLRKRLMDESILAAPHRSLIGDVRALYRRRMEAQLAEGAARSAVHASDIQPAADHRVAAPGGSMGPCFDRLTPDALVQVLLRLEARDVASLGATCRGLAAACADGEVWLAALRRSFPASPLRCARLADWRLAYALEANGVVPELACFFSRAGFQAEVLGLPFQFTVNPRTGRVDYILATSPDLAAVELVAGGLLRRDSRGNEVQGALPVYITQEHFERAQGHLAAALRQLCPGQLRPGPEQWLDVLPTALNTCAVLLSDHGIAASERALDTYCALHRLLLALCDRHGLWGGAERRVQGFLSSAARRSKEAVPSLGALIPLLAVSRCHEWQEAMHLLLNEAVDRQVLWVCKGDGGLVARYKRSPDVGGVDQQLLDGFFKHSTITLRLFMFHAAFLSLVARPRGRAVGDVMYRLDCLYGRPGAGLRRRFQAAVKVILDCHNLDQALHLLGMKRLSPEAWTWRLRTSWRNSLARGYHRANTDFSRVQAGGVSGILLRGQRYSTPPNLRAIEVDQRWQSKPGGAFVYLDASCLLYCRRDGPGARADQRGRCWVEAVDYCSRSSKSRDKSGVAVVRHSGDMVSGDCGQHTISINLQALPPTVAALYLMMSTWAGATLDQVVHPYASVRDPASGAELCSFQLEDVPASQRLANTSAVMLRIFRGRAAGQWEVEAIGRIGQGCAGSYGPIEEWIGTSEGSAAARRR